VQRLLKPNFIVRTVLEDLRIGIAIGTLRDGITFAFFSEGVIYDKEKNVLDYKLKEGVDIETTKKR